MKIVVTADCHIHPFKICSRDNGADRLRDGLSALRQSLELAKRVNATWVMAGDFKQPKTNWPQEALTGAHFLLRDPMYKDVPKVMIAGNHDAIGLGGSGLAPFKDVARVIETEAEEVEGLLCVPFGVDLTPVKPNRHLPVIAHAFIKGAFIGPEDMRLPGKGVDLADYGAFPVAFFGDIHNAQVRWPADPKRGAAPSWASIDCGGPVRKAGPWRGEVFYPGSPYMQNWGERNHAKGALLADLKTGEVSFHEFDAPRFVHVELENPTLVAHLAANSQDFVRIMTDDAKVTQRALGEMTFRSVQIIERRSEADGQRAARTNIHAAMDRDEMLAGYMKARPAPAGTDPEQVLTALKNLWSEDV